MTDPGPVVLFDGYCKLCDRTVQFLSHHEKEQIFEFVSLQSPAGQIYLEQYKLPEQDFDSFVLVEDGRAYQRSTAGLRVLKYLKIPWPLLGIMILVPPPIRDWAYQIIAHNRYRWFGRMD